MLNNITFVDNILESNSFLRTNNGKPKQIFVLLNYFVSVK